MEESFERAAAIAVFHGHVRRAVLSLKDGAQLANQQRDMAKSEQDLVVTSISRCTLLLAY